MPVIGYGSKLYVAPAAGTVSLAAEPSTQIGGSGTSKIYQITNAAKRCLDPAATIDVNIAGVPQAATAYLLDHLFGTIHFIGVDPAASAVTVTGTNAAFVSPLLEVTEVSSWSMESAHAEQDTTDMDSVGARKHVLGLGNWSLSFDTFLDPRTDLDAGGGTVRLSTLKENRTPFLVELAFGNTGVLFRGWVLPPGLSRNGRVSEVVKHSWRLAGDSQKRGASFGWSDQVTLYAPSYL